MQNRGTCCLKKCFNMERSKGNFVRENLKKYALNSEGSLKYNKVRPSNYLFQLFLTLYGRAEENSSYFSNVQPCTITCIWDALLNCRICRYTYSINTTLL